MPNHLVKQGECLSSIAAQYPAGCRQLLDGGTWNNLAGQPTDDSELALLLARTLVEEGKHEPAAVLAAPWGLEEALTRPAPAGRARAGH